MNLDRVRMLEQFAKDDPGDPFPLYALALEYEKTQPDRACQYFEKTLNLTPGYLPVYYPYANLLMRLAKSDHAKSIFSKGIILAGSQKDLKTLAELQSAYGEHFE